MTPEQEAFSRLHPVLQHHVVNTLGWESLRGLQVEAVEPVLKGADALLLAPTAGGKTEAAAFPVLSRMASESWQGLSVLYVAPLKALLNNLEPRLAAYAGWLGRRAEVRHGDTSAADRRHQRDTPPDLMLTTPESLEAMLVSRLNDPHTLFSELRTVIIDEIHAFAGDDRGWHLLAVIERLGHLSGRQLQRVGLSATVGNAPGLLSWLQGSNRGHREATVVSPEGPHAVDTSIEVDYVGSLDNAATVISALHHGEKRLVFADSRRSVETVAQGLRARDTETFVSHSSVALGERRRAEQAFAESRDCVIASTSTLELGVDVGDLDRVIQIGAPTAVSSMLQRLGRTGRRPGTVRNMLFLATDDEELLRSLALSLLWSEGYVEAVHPPAAPRHVAAQQALGLALQERRIDPRTWTNWIAGSGVVDAADAEWIITWLVETQHLDMDSGLAFIGPEVERKWGSRHFMELVAVFTAPPEVTVRHQNEDIGSVDPIALVERRDGPPSILLGGRAWTIVHVDWRRRLAWAEPSDAPADVRWSSPPQPLSYALVDACRRVLLGANPVGVSLGKRARTRLAALRDDWSDRVDEEMTVVTSSVGRPRWWTWGGLRANAVLTEALRTTAPEVLAEEARFDNLSIGVAERVTGQEIEGALRQVRAWSQDNWAQVLPAVDAEALRHLKFSELLPSRVAKETLALRGVDHLGARAITLVPVRAN